MASGLVTPNSGCMSLDNDLAAQERRATVTQPNEEMLKKIYTSLNAGDFEGFLAGCTDDATFVIPGSTSVSGTFTGSRFMDLLAPVVDHSQGWFLEHVLAVAANDEHGIVLVFERFNRDGELRHYRTSHIITFRDGRIATWEEHPGSMADFEAAWASQASAPSRNSLGETQQPKQPHSGSMT
jgi:ketosteroid isomerase-like protein